MKIAKNLTFRRALLAMINNAFFSEITTAVPPCDRLRKPEDKVVDSLSLPGKRKMSVHFFICDI